MIARIFLIIISFFLIGGFGIWHINKKLSKVQGQKNWTKYTTFFFIINIIFFSIVVNPVYFHYISLMILAAGFLELFSLFRGSGFAKPLTFAISFLIFFLLSIGFYYFSWMKQEVLLFTFLIVAGFDSFSQIIGQIMGKHKILPDISPGKTLEGFMGGSAVSYFFAFLVSDYIDLPLASLMILTTGIILSAFGGDLLSSVYKRKYNVKDYSNILPGHGGFLDRFDSLIMAGTFISFYYIISKIFY